MSIRKPPRRYSRLRLFLYRMVVSFFSFKRLGYRLYARCLRKGAIEVVTQPHGQHDPARAFRVVQLSDLHAGPFLDAHSLRDLVDEVNRLKPHVLVITGDFITNGPEEVDVLVPALSRIDAKCGAFAIFGNHDYRYRREAHIQSRLAEAGIRVLRNENECLRFQDRKITIIGIEDIEEGKYPDLENAFKNIVDESIKVLLSHNPDVIDLIESNKIDLVLSGHTHGGQIAIPGLKNLGSGYCGPYIKGLFNKVQARLYVNRGIGVLVLPFRIGSRPEITLHLL